MRSFLAAVALLMLAAVPARAAAPVLVLAAHHQAARILASERHKHPQRSYTLATDRACRRVSRLHVDCLFRERHVDPETGLRELVTWTTHTHRTAGGGLFTRAIASDPVDDPGPVVG